MSTRTPNPQFTIGDPVAVSALEVGDTVYAKHDHTTQEPTTPVIVTALRPSRKTEGLMRITVQSPYQRVSPFTLGWLRLDKTLPRAVPVA